MSGMGVVLYAIVSVTDRLHRLSVAYTGAARASCFRAMLAMLFCFLATLPCLLAARADEPGIRVNREIVALYDGREETTADSTRVHHAAEMPLNYLGYTVSYWDVSKGLPDFDRLANAQEYVAVRQLFWAFYLVKFALQF